MPPRSSNRSGADPPAAEPDSETTFQAVHANAATPAAAWGDAVDEGAPAELARLEAERLGAIADASAARAEERRTGTSTGYIDKFNPTERVRAFFFLHLDWTY